MIACRPNASQPSPTIGSTHRLTAEGGPVFLPRRQPSAFARRLVDELEQQPAPTAEAVTVHGG